MTDQPQYILDREELDKYMCSRAEEFQHRGDWNSAFECLYLITVINRGWYWDTTGRHHVQIRSNAPAPTARVDRLYICPSSDTCKDKCSHAKPHAKRMWCGEASFDGDECPKCIELRQQQQGGKP